MHQEEHLLDHISYSQGRRNKSIQSNVSISLSPLALSKSPQNFRHMEHSSTEYGRSNFIQRRPALYGGKETINDANPQAPDTPTFTNTPSSPFQLTNEWKMRERKKNKRRKEKKNVLETVVVLVMVFTLFLFAAVMYFMKIEDKAQSSNISRPLYYSQESKLNLISNHNHRNDRNEKGANDHTSKTDEIKVKKFTNYSKPRLLFYLPESNSHSVHKNVKNMTTDERNDIQTSNIFGMQINVNRTSHFMPDPMLKVTPGEECTPQRTLKQYDQESNCVPMHKWQIDNKPTCNTIHEIDIAWEQNLTLNDDKGEQIISLLGKGWFRLAWKIEQTNIYDDEDMEENYILKTLR